MPEDSYYVIESNSPVNLSKLKGYLEDRGYHPEVEYEEDSGTQLNPLNWFEESIVELYFKRFDGKEVECTSEEARLRGKGSTAAVEGMLSQFYDGTSGQRFILGPNEYM